MLAGFDFVNPEKNVPELLSIKKGLETLPASKWTQEKLERCKQIILDCLGLFIEITGDDYAYVNGETIDLNLNMINRSNINVKLMAVNYAGDSVRTFNTTLPENEMVSAKISQMIWHKMSNPYWLEHTFVNLFKVSDSSNLGLADNKPRIIKTVTFEVAGEHLDVEVPVTYKWRDPSYGERRRAVVSSPDFSLNFDQKLAILKPNESKMIRMKVHSFKSDLKDEIRLSGPAGWTITPSVIPVNIKDKHEEIWIQFELKSAGNGARGPLKITNANGGDLYTYTEITYDHIPTQVIFKKAELECIKLEAKIKPGRIAYIKGVDDVVPQAIEQLGFKVSVYEVSDLSIIDLSMYQTVVLGIRIFNVHPELKNFEDKIYSYVEKGGNVVMQYNTASRGVRGQTFGPKPFELSRNRVTEEDAEVTLLKPDHRVMSYPNKITVKDFDGWVQERGLYFADNWDESYQPLLSWQDEGEEAQHGALIVGRYGEGQFVYTGISFFRELPNGVEGAYRLFANLLSY